MENENKEENTWTEVNSFALMLSNNGLITSPVTVTHITVDSNNQTIICKTDENDELVPNFHEMYKWFFADDVDVEFNLETLFMKRVGRRIV